MSYLSRNCEESVRYLMKKFPCVAILGSRQVGKTSLIKHLCPDAPFFDLELREHYRRIKSDPDFFLSQYDVPIVIDEAQEIPELFPALRVAIDNHREHNGRFLISGSSSPDLLKNITESLAGRIAIFELSPMSIFEMWQTGKSDFVARVREKAFALPEKRRFDDGQIKESFLFGGYPEAFLHREDLTFWKQWMNQYYLNYVNRDIRKLFSTLNFQAFQRFIGMLSHTSGELINYSRFAKSLDLSVPTVRSYLEICEGTFLWRRLVSYSKNVSRRVSKSPKGHMVDSGLVHFLTNITSQEALYNHVNVGLYWEAFVIEQVVRIFADALEPAKMFHYRTHNGAEIDLIVEGDFGTIPMEIKLGTSDRIKTLGDFVQEHKLPYGVLINNGREPCWVHPKVVQIPLSYL